MTCPGLGLADPELGCLSSRVGLSRSLKKEVQGSFERDIDTDVDVEGDVDVAGVCHFCSLKGDRAPLKGM